MYDDHNLPIIARSSYQLSVIIYALIVPSTYTTTSVTLSLSHHGKLPRPFEQEAQKDVSFQLQLFPWNRE